MSNPGKACKVCGQIKELEEFHRDSALADGRRHVCKDCAKARTASYRVTNAEQVRAYDYDYKRDPEVMARNRAQLKRLHAADRAAAFQHYGERCTVCESTEDLQIAQFNDDGQERLCTDYEARTIYRWLRKHGYPDGFQTLCRGCNRAKARARQEPTS